MQHVGGEREACGVTAQHRLVQQVLGDHGLAQSIGTDDDDVGCLFEEGEGEQLLQQRTIDLLGPGVIEVGQRLESTQAGVVCASLGTALLTLAVLDLQHTREPRLGDDLLGVRCEPIEVQPAQARSQRLNARARRCGDDQRARWRTHLCVHGRSLAGVVRSSIANAGAR